MSNENNNSKESKNAVSIDFQQIIKNKNALIIAAIVVFVFLLAVVPILINVFSDDAGDVIPDNPDMGLVLSGTYAENIGVGSSKYSFDGDKVTNTYNVNGVTETIVYTYVIAIEKGVKVIKLTPVKDDGTTETTTHEFEQGKFGEVPFISINNVMYYLSDD